jgi:hypothetical protein
MTQTHPPIANRVACIDFDGTIVPWGPLMATKEPFPRVADAIRFLKHKGFTIAIHTSRASVTWLLSQGLDIGDQLEYVARILRDNDIPFDTITAEKIPAEVYFDDKAIQVSEDYPLDHAILDFLAGHADMNI